MFSKKYVVFFALILNQPIIIEYNFHRKNNKHANLAAYRKWEFHLCKCTMNMILRESFKKYVDFCHTFFSRRQITLRFGTHIWTTNYVDLQ